MPCTQFIRVMLWLVIAISLSPLAYGDQPVPVSVKGLELNQAPSDPDLMAAGQLGGVLYPSDYDGAPVSVRSTSASTHQHDGEANLSFGQAIEAWNKHEYSEAVELFDTHIKQFPDSAWTPEAQIHLACEAGYQGRNNAAGDMYQSVLATAEQSSNLGNVKLANKARLRLGTIAVQDGNFEAAQQRFGELFEKGTDWRERTYASHWIRRLNSDQAQESALLNCGYLALSDMLSRKGKQEEAAKIRELQVKGTQGQSIADLKALAQTSGYELVGLALSMEELDKISLPAITLIKRKEGTTGHYWILEDKQGDTLSIHDPQSRRHFRQTTAEFQQEWDSIVLVFKSSHDTLPGRLLSDQEMGDLYGGCCGLPLIEQLLENFNLFGIAGFFGMDSKSNASATGTGVNSNPTCPKECGWSVNPVNMNFFMVDTPMWYAPNIGPAVNITVNYNSQSALAYNEPFGNKWQFNYGTYLVLDPGDTATIFMPDGRREIFTGDGNGSNYTASFSSHKRLTRLGANKWELTFFDGSSYLYDIRHYL